MFESTVSRSVGFQTQRPAAGPDRFTSIRRRYFHCRPSCLSNCSEPSLPFDYSNREFHSARPVSYCHFLLFITISLSLSLSLSLARSLVCSFVRFPRHPPHARSVPSLPLSVSPSPFCLPFLPPGKLVPFCSPFSGEGVDAQPMSPLISRSPLRDS